MMKIYEFESDTHYMLGLVKDIEVFGDEMFYHLHRAIDGNSQKFDDYVLNTEGFKVTEADDRGISIFIEFAGDCEMPEEEQ